jgi:two-component system nitrogen regulation response regulator GlnG
MAEAPAVWIVDDDRSVRFVLAEALAAAGLSVREFEAAEPALAALDAGAPQLVFTDIRMPGLGGLAFLEQLKARAPALPVVVMSAWTDLPSTAGAFQGGAQEFLSKPFDLDDAVALAERVLEREPTVADTPAAPAAPDGELLGNAPAMRALVRAIGRLARAPLTVLITGETGTGKELVARALHRHSPRAAAPFVALNTAAIPAELLESELFGHEAGAFTGARERRIGRFEQAHGGTLFLDEIGDMPLPLQTRLLRVLAEGQFFRVGGRALIEVDVRVIAATHQELEARVAEGAFRADLLHRLDVVRLAVPPLRERSEDIPLLAQRFLDEAARQLELPPKRLAKTALEALVRHAWPGNVRELENLCWRLAALAPGAVIRRDDLPDTLRAVVPAGGADWEAALRRWAEQRLAEGAGELHGQAMARAEAILFEAALAATGGHRQHAAERLGVGRNTLTRKLGSTRRRR